MMDAENKLMFESQNGCGTDLSNHLLWMDNAILSALTDCIALHKMCTKYNDAVQPKRAGRKNTIKWTLIHCESVTNKIHQGIIRAHYDILLRKLAETRSQDVNMCAKYRIMEIISTLILAGMEQDLDRNEIWEQNFESSLSRVAWHAKEYCEQMFHMPIGIDHVV